MITYFIEGKKPSKKLRAFTQDCINSLFGDNQPYFDIDINLRKSVKKGQFAGLCTGDDKGVMIDLATHFRMDCGSIEEFEPHEFASNLAHELVHAKQFARNQINSIDYIWTRGEIEVDCSNLEYLETPWEVEAYGLEQVLTDLFWEEED
jgi:hypothetical protein